MDWKVKRRRNLEESLIGNPLQMRNQIQNKNEKLRRRHSNSTKHPSHLWFLSLTLLVLCHILTPGHCFFFPKSLFRRLSPASPPNPPQQQQQGQNSPAHETLIASEQQIQPGVRIANRPPSYQQQNQQQGSQPNPNFHVPKALCIACERFPWMPVSGPEKPTNGGQLQPQQSQQSSNGVDGQPSKTIIISALGEAKGPVPVPPASANRKPFAIQFDSAKSQNTVNVQSNAKQPTTGYIQSTHNNEVKNTDPATRPISFQIYDPPRQPTVLQPANPSSKPQPQQQQQGGYPQEPSPFMQPPTNSGFQFQQMQQNGFRPDIRIQSMSFGRPTILRPVNALYFPAQSNNNGPPQQNNQGYGGPPPPLPHNNNNNAFRPPSPPQNNNGYGPPQQQNNNNIFGPPPSSQNNQGYGPPPLQQNQQINFGPPPQSNNIGYGPPPQSQRNNNQQHQQSQVNYAPIPPITISTIVAAQHGRPQNQNNNNNGPVEFQAIQPAKLVYQEHTQIHGPSIAPYKNGPQIQYGKPFPPPPQPPQNIKMPIISRPFGGPNERPSGQYGQPQNGPPQGGYLPPQPQSRPPPGSYLPPPQQQQGQQRPIGNQVIANLRPPQFHGGYLPPPQQQGQNPQQGQVFFPPPQATIQYGAPRPQNPQNQVGESQQSSNSIQNLVKSGPNPQQHSNDVNQMQPQGKPQTSDSQHSTNIVPIPVPNIEEPSTDYHPSGSNNLNQHDNPSSSNAIQTPNKIEFNPPKGVVKNPHIQSIENLKSPVPTKDSIQPTKIPLTQESGWEIIPAVQTDITHLFQNPQPTRPIEQQPKQVTVPVPLPVPIPIPESHASKSPLFIVRGQGSRQVDGPQQNSNIFVQGVTYHEENRGGNNPAGEEKSPPAAQSQTQSVTVPPTYQTQIPDNSQQQQRQPVGLPIVQPQFILRPHPGNQFDPLPPSISTALYHAQRTSYLTHQYLSQSGAGIHPNSGGRTVYVHSVPVQQNGPQTSYNIDNNNNNYASPSPSNIQTTQILRESSPSSGNGNSVPNDNNVGDQTPVNCQTHQQWVTSFNNQIGEAQKTEGEQSSAAASFSSGGGPSVNEQKPYLVYYPTPVQQSSIYWVQPPQQAQGGSQGFLRLRPQSQSSNNEEESKDSSNSVVFSPPVREWSKIVTQSHSVSEDQKQQKPQTESETSGQSQGDSDETNREVDDEYSLRIPFGQKLPKRTTVTPFDIISVDSKNEPADETHVQSLEEDSSQSQQSQDVDQRNSQQQNSYQQSSESSSQDSNRNEGQNHLNDFSNGNQDFENQKGGTILRPVSTTIIHSPDATSFASQTFNYQGFKPQKVIVHDFTKGGGGISSIIEDQEQQQLQEQDRAVGQQSQNIQSWRAFNHRPKSPKLVENYPVNDNEEEKQFLTSVSNNKVLSYQNPVEILATGSVTTAECATAHTEPLTVTNASTEKESQTFSTGNPAEAKEKVRLRVGARFPAGRPSLTSFNSWTVTTTTPFSAPVEYGESQSSLEQENDSQSPDSYSASISIPAYRPPNVAREIQNQASGSTTNSFSPPSNLLILEDIYKNSELKQNSLQQPTTTTEEQSSGAITEDAFLATMSTEKSSSFSISVDESSGGMIEGEQNAELDSNTPRKVPHLSDGQKVEIRERESSISSQTSGQSVHIVTSATVLPSAYDRELLTTTTTPSPASTSTKIVKTVRVRQRMRHGGGGNFNGTIRSRFNGPGRIRVVQRPVTPEYVKHFPEFASPESEKLAKEEEEEVKNALIELKRSERAKA